jgi:sugar phosphate isomerase/epimerase
MQRVSRRRFLGAGVMGGAAGYLSAGAGKLAADPLGLPIGFQVYPVRQQIEKDFAGTLKEFAAVGYRACEMCSPIGYTKSGFGSLTAMKASEIRGIIHDAGLICESSHFTFQELKKDLPGSLAYAKQLGLKQVIISTFALPHQGATMDAWRAAAEEANKMGVAAKKAGLQLGFHNHNMEFEKVDGVLIYDELMKALDPKLVKMQFQVAVISQGYKAADFFKKYPGRFLSIHLQDWVPGERDSTPIGQGKVDWKELFAAAKTGGVKNYFVEVSPQGIKQSYPFLHELSVS